MENLPERDWKKLRSLKNTALNEACERILENILSLIESGKNEGHKTYKELWRILQEEDEKISLMFDDLKRSTAIFKLVMWKENGILSEHDFVKLTEETKNRINSIIEMRR